MQTFKTVLKKPEIKGSLTLIELPFNPAHVFNIGKGTIKVFGTINGKEYRNKLTSRGNGLYIMTIDKTLQKRIGFVGDALEIEVTMNLDESAMHCSGKRETIEKHTCELDILTAIRTRRSIRTFNLKEVETSKIETILEAGFCAPTAKNKRPWYFIVSRDKDFMAKLADANNYKSLLTADCLREKVIPIAIIALGYPAEEKEFVPRYDETKVHWEML